MKRRYSQRRKDLVQKYVCPHRECEKKYASAIALNLHLKKKHSNSQITVNINNCWLSLSWFMGNFSKGFMKINKFEETEEIAKFYKSHLFRGIKILKLKVGKSCQATGSFLFNLRVILTQIIQFMMFREF